jgi:hypothetical protein
LRPDRGPQPSGGPAARPGASLAEVAEIRRMIGGGTKLMLSRRLEGVETYYTPRFWNATLKP